MMTTEAAEDVAFRISGGAGPRPWPLLRRLGTLGERRAGTPAAGRARREILRHVAGRVPEAQIREESFTLDVASDASAEVACQGERFAGFLYDNTGIGGGTVRGRPLWAGRFLTPWQAARAGGRIVVCTHSLLVHRVMQVHAARKHGAAGVVIVSGHDAHVQRGIGYPTLLERCPLPAVGVTRAQGRRLAASGGAVELRYRATLAPARFTNVIVDLPGTSEGVIVLGAHFDSWHAGYHDNAVAVQMLADLLERLARGGRLRHRIRAVFFDGEERGVLGAYHHVRHNPLDAYRFYLNLEMPVPTREGRLKTFFYTPDPVVRGSFSRTALLRRGILPVSLRLFYRLFPVFPADVDSFYRHGIPSATTFCSNPYVHTPLDTLDRIRMDRYPEALAFLERLVRRVDRRIGQERERA